MSITGAVKIIDVPDDACLTTVRDLLLQLEKFLAVEFEAEQITNVVVSSDEPEISERNIIWFKIDNAGNFKGIYVYVQGQWLQMFPPPQALIRMYGDSRSIPEGYALADANISGISETTAGAIQNTWHKDTEEQDYYQVFDVVYVGL